MASIEQNKKKEHLENFLKELGIKRPLRVSELNKDDIRTLSKDLELPTWNNQSFTARRLRPLRWEMNGVYTYLIEHPNYSIVSLVK